MGSHLLKGLCQIYIFRPAQIQLMKLNCKTKIEFRVLFRDHVIVTVFFSVNTIR